MAFIRNLGKSVKYILPTVARSLMPNSTANVNNVISFSREVKDTIANASQVVKQQGVWKGIGELTPKANDKYDDDLGMGGSLFGSLQEGLKVMSKGMTTGDFTNQSSNDAFGLGGDDFTDFGDFDFDSEDGESRTTSGSVDIGSVGNRTISNNVMAPNIITNISASGSNKRATDASIQAIRLGTSINASGFNKLAESMFHLNDNVAKIAEFNVTHNVDFNRQTMLFYSSVEMKLSSIMDKLQTSNDLAKARDELMGLRNSANYAESEYSRIVGSGGVLNFKEYFSNAFKKMKGGGDLVNMAFGDQIRNPLALLTEALIPASAKKAAADIDEMVGMMPQLLALKANKMTNKSELLQLAQFAGIDFTLNDGHKVNKMDISKGSKNAAHFNALTQKTIVTVIPNLLSKLIRVSDRNNIYGKEELHFDHGSGSFKTKSQAMDKLGKSRDGAIRNSTTDFEEFLGGELEKRMKGSSYQDISNTREAFMKDFVKVFEKAAIKNEYVSAKEMKAGDYGLDANSDSWKVMQDILGNKRAERMLNVQIPKIRESMDRQNRSIENFDPSYAYVHSLLASGVNPNDPTMSRFNYIPTSAGSSQKPISKQDAQKELAKKLFGTNGNAGNPTQGMASSVSGLTDSSVLDRVGDAVNPYDTDSKSQRGKREPKNNFTKFISKVYNAPFDAVAKFTSGKKSRLDNLITEDMSDEQITELVREQKQKGDKIIGFMTKFGNSVKKYTINPILDFMMGKKDPEGERTGGVLDNTFKKINEFSSKLFHNTKSALFGKEYVDDKGNLKFKVGLIDSFKGYSKEFKDDLTTYFLGNKKEDPETGKMIRTGGYLKQLSKSFKEDLITPAKQWFGLEKKTNIKDTKDYLSEKWNNMGDLKRKLSDDVKDGDMMARFQKSLWNIQANMAVKLFGARNDEGELLRDENGKPLYGGFVQSATNQMKNIIGKVGSTLFGDFDDNGNVTKKGLLTNAVLITKDIIGFGKDQMATFGNFVRDKVYTNIGPKVWLPFVKELGYQSGKVVDIFKDKMSQGIGWINEKFKKETGKTMHETVRDSLLNPLMKSFNFVTDKMGKAISMPMEKFKGWSDNLAKRQAERQKERDKNKTPEQLEKERKFQEFKDQWLDRKRRNKEKRDAEIETKRLANRTPSEKALDSINEVTKDQAKDIRKIANALTKPHGMASNASALTGGVNGVKPSKVETIDGAVLGGDDKAESNAKKDAGFIRRLSREKNPDKANRSFMTKATELLSHTASNIGGLKKTMGGFGSFLLTSLISPLLGLIKTGVIGGLARVAAALGMKGIAGALGGGGGLDLDPNNPDGRNNPNDPNGQNTRRGRRRRRNAANGGRSRLRNVGSKLGAGAKKAGGFLARNGSKIIPGVGLALGAWDGISGYANAEEILGKEGEELTFGNKLSAGLGSVANGLSFGLINEGGAANFFNKGLGWMGGSEKKLPHGKITSGFGSRVSPFSGKRVFHPGTDVALRKGTPVGSMLGNGKVTKVGSDSTLGKNVEVEHSNGVKTRYGHLDSVNVKTGQRVNGKTPLGRSGNTGKSTGPHLHFEAKKNGKYINTDKIVSNRFKGGTEEGGEKKSFFDKIKSSVGGFFGKVFGGNKSEENKETAVLDAKRVSAKNNGISANGEEQGSSPVASVTGGFKKALGSLELFSQEGNILSKMKNKFDKSVADNFLDPIKKRLNDIYEIMTMKAGMLGSSGASNSSSSINSSFNGDVTLSGNDNEQKVWNFFKEQGFNDTAIAGIMGNLRQESGLDPSKKQYGGGPGRGIMQWETGHSGNGGRGRWNHLEDWAKQSGKDPWALETQLQYIMKEMSGDAEDKYNGHILKSKFGGVDALKAMSTKEAANAFERSMERAGKPMMEKRLAYADEYLSKYGNTGGVELAFMGGTEQGTTGSASIVKPVDEDKFRITSKYGPRTHPVTGQKGKMHEGIDYGTPEGTPISAMASGKVVFAKPLSTYGNVIYIDHDNGIQTRYAHLKNGGMKVKVGDRVEAGQVIALSGNTGGSTGPHLHFETRRITNPKATTSSSASKSFDPIPYLQGKSHVAGSILDSDGAVTSSGIGGAVSGVFSSIKDWFSSKIKYANIQTPGSQEAGGTEVQFGSNSNRSMFNSGESFGMGGTEQSYHGPLDTVVSLLQEILSTNKEFVKKELIVKIDDTKKEGKETTKPSKDDSVTAAAKSKMNGLFTGGGSNTSSPNKPNKKINMIASGTI